MPTNFPGALDSLPRPGASSPMDVAPYRGSVVIDNISDAIEAVQAKLGIGASTPGAGASVLRRNAVGGSIWQPIQLGDIDVNAVAMGNLLQNAVTNAVTAAISGAVNTSSTTAVDMPGGQINAGGTAMTLVGGLPLLIIFEGIFSATPANTLNTFSIAINGSVVASRQRHFVTASVNEQVMVVAVVTSTAGTPTISMKWNTSSGGTLSQGGTQRSLTAIEFRR